MRQRMLFWIFPIGTDGFAHLPCVAGQWERFTHEQAGYGYNGYEVVRGGIESRYTDRQWTVAKAICAAVADITEAELAALRDEREARNAHGPAFAFDAYAGAGVAPDTALKDLTPEQSNIIRANLVRCNQRFIKDNRQ